MRSLFTLPGYRIWPPDSPEAGALLAEQGLAPSDLDRAVAELRGAGWTIVGMNEDALFASPAEDRSDFTPLLWIRVLETLGRAPAGSATRFIRDGALPPPGIHTG